MLEAHIEQQFFDAADLLNQTAQALSPAVTQAATAVVGCLTAGGRLLCAGQDAAQMLAAHAAALFTGRLERARPPLPAMALLPQANWAGAFAQPAPAFATQALLQQLQALGQPGDVLLLFATGQDAAALHTCVQAAHDKDLTVVAVLTPSDSTLQGLLRETDVALPLPAQRLPRVLELQLLVLHSLADAIDTQLLGEQDFA